MYLVTPLQAGRQSHTGSKEFHELRDEFSNHILLIQTIRDIIGICLTAMEAGPELKALGQELYALIPKANEITIYDGAYVLKLPEKFGVLCSQCVPAANPYDPSWTTPYIELWQIQEEESALNLTLREYAGRCADALQRPTSKWEGTAQMHGSNSSRHGKAGRKRLWYSGKISGDKLQLFQ